MGVAFRPSLASAMGQPTVPGNMHPRPSIARRTVHYCASLQLMDQMQPAKRRGRPPKGKTAMDAATRQRLYLERKAMALAAATAPPAADPDAPDLAWYQARHDTMQGQLRKALDEAAFLRSDRERFEARAYKAEARMRDAERLHGLALNDKIVLQKRIAELEAKPAKRRKIPL